jgi:M3 family oligoendopeptidase
MQTSPRFSDLPYRRPDKALLGRASADLLARWDASSSVEEEASLIREWDKRQIELSTLGSLAQVHFTQDTSNPDFKAEKTFFDDLNPELMSHDVAFLGRVTKSAHRDSLIATFGRQAFALWDCFLGTFDARIADHKRKESGLETQYVEWMAGQRLQFKGQELNLSQLRAFYGNKDRATRLAALQARDGCMQQGAELLDQLYSDLVAVRHEMATTLGYENYIPLAYAQMDRTDYTAVDVGRYRAQVREVVVPLASRIYAKRSKALGYPDFGWQDESVRDHRGVPRPNGDHDWMLERATELFDGLGSDFGTFFQMMRDRELLDLKAREGKAGGGYCAGLPSHEIPFIFANFNGTQDDVNVFTHECGHAFQNWSSRGQPLMAYLWPTIEAAEIHSMSLEFLCYPHMEKFFGDDAERYREGHLESAALFLPYGSAVDEFQHRVFENPGMSSGERAECWQEIESIYLPNRRYQDMPHASSGRMWQIQRHIYLRPFYYIDYCLAQTCALQMWKSSTEDLDATLTRYRLLCDLGGSLPFTGLLTEVGLTNPFEDGCLQSVCGAVETTLGL